MKNRRDNLFLAIPKIKILKPETSIERKTMKKQTHELWSLLITEDRHTFTPKQVKELIAARPALCHLIDQAKDLLCEGLEELERYRDRKAQLEALHPEKLQAMYDNICAERANTIAADVHDGLSDSLFEPEPIDSDEHILFEIFEADGVDYPAKLQLAV